MSYSFWRPQPWRPGALAPLRLWPPSYATVCATQPRRAYCSRRTGLASSLSSVTQAVTPSCLLSRQPYLSRIGS